MDTFHLIAGSMERGEEPKILPEVAIVRLQEVAKLYAEQLHAPRFAVGDIVTPRKDSTINGSGDPGIVIDVKENAQPDFSRSDSDTVRFGARFDIRVLSIRHGDAAAFWCESFEFEPWTEQPKAQ